MGCDVIGQFDREMSMYIAVEKISYDVIHVSITPKLCTTNLCGVGNDKSLENIASIFIYKTASAALDSRSLEVRQYVTRSPMLITKLPARHFNPSD